MASRIEYVVYVYANDTAGEYVFKTARDAAQAAAFASHYQAIFSNIANKNCTAVSYRNAAGTLAVSVTKIHK